MRNRKLKSVLLSTAALVAVAAAVTSNRPVAAQGFLTGLTPVFNIVDQLIGDIQTPSPVNVLKTKTPIKHLVVIFNENRSFDHYFGTYPKAMNPAGEPAFTAARNTPIPNNYESNPSLLTANPNFLNPANNVAATAKSLGSSAANPFRLDRTQAATADQDHGYTPEQLAFDGGKLDLFPLDTGAGTSGGAGVFGNNAQVMGYFDGNTVTAFWNYAQNFAMSDNSWGDNFGPSTPGALNMFSGQTNGASFPVVPPGTPASPTARGALLAAADAAVLNTDGSFTLISDIDPAGDVCSSTTITVQMAGKNIGDLLNAANIPWGSFVGGFNLQTVNPNMSTGCSRSTVGQLVSARDYTPHHIWFQYFASTANPTHARPTSTAAIGLTLVPGTKTVDPANHGYDLADFTAAVQAGNFPAVSFIKQASFQDGHPGNSDPLDEQTGLVNLINFLQQQPDWSSTAVIIAYDDSDGWYDHAFASTAHGSFASAAVLPGVDVDVLNGNGNCGTPGVTPVAPGLSGQAVNGRCGPGTRQPFVVISPYAKKNYISHVLITQASIPQFIEDNWLKSERLGGGSFDATTGSIMDMFDFDQIVANGAARQVILDPMMGTVTSSAPGFPF